MPFKVRCKLVSFVGDPERFGVAALDEENKMILNIEEKPDRPKSKYAVIGVYMYDSSVYEIIKKIKPSERGEIEISDVNNEYVKQNQLTYGVASGGWTDAGTLESLLFANKMLFEISNEIRTGDINEDSIQ